MAVADSELVIRNVHDIPLSEFPTRASPNSTRNKIHVLRRTQVATHVTRLMRASNNIVCSTTASAGSHAWTNSNAALCSKASNCLRVRSPAVNNETVTKRSVRADNNGTLCSGPGVKCPSIRRRDFGPRGHSVTN